MPLVIVKGSRKATQKRNPSIYRGMVMYWNTFRPLAKVNLGPRKHWTLSALHP